MKKFNLFLQVAISLGSACSKELDACFEHEVTSNKVNFDATCTIHATFFLSDFGDGGSSEIATPLHAYSGVGNYTVTLLWKQREGSLLHVRSTSPQVETS